MPVFLTTLNVSSNVEKWVPALYIRICMVSKSCNEKPMKTGSMAGALQDSVFVLQQLQNRILQNKIPIIVFVLINNFPTIVE